MPRTKSNTAICKGPTKDMNRLVFHLNIEMDDRVEVADSQLVEISPTRLMYYDEVEDELVPLTAAQKKKPGFIGSTMTLYNEHRDCNGKILSNTRMTFLNTKGQFTIRQVVKCICEFEMKDRPKSNCMGRYRRASHLS